MFLYLIIDELCPVLSVMIICTKTIANTRCNKTGWGGPVCAKKRYKIWKWEKVAAAG